MLAHKKKNTYMYHIARYRIVVNNSRKNLFIPQRCKILKSDWSGGVLVFTTTDLTGFPAAVEITGLYYFI